jgi:oligosaccharide repeat unit polymerase
MIDLSFLGYKVLSILISLLIYSLSKLLKRLNGGSHTPATLYCSFWFLFTFLPTILLFNVPMRPLAIFYIFISAIAFSIPSLFFNWKLAFLLSEKKKAIFLEIFDGKLFKRVYWFSFLASFFFLSLMLKQNGFSLVYFLVDFLGTSSQFANTRTIYDYQYGIIGQFTSYFPFLTATLGGFISYNSKKKGFKQIGFFLISILPSIFSMLLQSSKILLLYGVVFYISSWLILRIYSGNTQLIPSNATKSLTFILILFTPLLILAFRAREGFNEFGIIELIPVIASYFFGSIYAFSDYFNSLFGLETVSRYIDEEHLTLGYYSFKPFFEFFGGTKIFPIGYYEDYFNYNGTIQSNIFTYFRLLIQDFGLFGSILFIFFMGFIIHLFYFFIFKFSRPYLSICIFFTFLIFLGMSYLFNIFTSRSVIMIALTLYVMLKVNSVILVRKSGNYYER